MKDIQVKVEYEASDFFRILLWHSWKKFALSLLLILAILGLFALSAVIAKPKDPINDRRVLLYIPLVAAPILSVGYFLFVIRRRSRKLAEGAIEETDITFSDKGIESRSSQFSANVSWQQYKKIIEISDDFVFFPQDNLFFGIPKRCFESDDQIIEFRALLTANLGNKARLKS